ncbi:MAG: molybdenum cofactor guanylyltransferase [Candidatus Omnitrophica bacterium]|nr:molybdenum cofactor guanylyltransferase [Candidatus Omnitrophota bacterium]
MEAIILAKGEKSKRLNLDKSFIEIGNKKIIEIIIEKISQLFKKIHIVSILPEKFIIYKNEKIDILKDVLKCGPIGGIYIGLKNSKSLYNFVFACDLPFINVDFIRYMINIKKDYDVLVPVYNGNFEVLHSIYTKNILNTIENLIKEKNFKVKEILKKVNVRYIEENQIKKICKDENIFFNLNTEENLKQILI